MGHISSSERFFSKPEKMNSILNMKLSSRSANEVRSFLALATYCGKFISTCATITEPLRNEEQKSTFSKTKSFISKALVLSYFHPAFEANFFADASKQVLGAGLLQKNLKIVFSTNSSHLSFIIGRRDQVIPN